MMVANGRGNSGDGGDGRGWGASVWASVGGCTPCVVQIKWGMSLMENVGENEMCRMQMRSRRHYSDETFSLDNMLEAML